MLPNDPDKPPTLDELLSDPDDALEAAGECNVMASHLRGLLLEIAARPWSDEQKSEITAAVLSFATALDTFGTNIRHIAALGKKYPVAK